GVFGAAAGNSILANAIFNNTGLGIDLAAPGDPANGVTPNDPGDTDVGPNDLQNAPALGTLSFYTNHLLIDGTLSSLPLTSFRLDFFAGAAADGSGFGEGDAPLGTTVVTTDAAGVADIKYDLAVTTNLLNQVVTATATRLSDHDGNPATPLILTDTSEFSPARTVQSAFVVTNTNDQRNGSLRAAILAANANPGTDTITFQIPGTGLKTISLASALPAITEPVIINGYSQPGARPNTLASDTDAVLNIELDGSGAGPAASGLTITVGGGGSMVRGLVINRFRGSGIEVLQGGNVIEGNYIGIDATSSPARVGNGVHGVFINGAASNTIGGTSPGARNVISGNAQHGVAVAGSTNNVIAGNYIGTYADGGTTAIGRSTLGNGIDGVAIINSLNNTVGGASGPFGNRISDNFRVGVDVIEVFGGISVGNTIRRNSIFRNNNLGIDLGANGPTDNDNGDPDGGPNRLQNRPVLTSGSVSPGSTRIRGSLNSTPSTTGPARRFLIEFYTSPEADPTGSGEGQRYLGERTVTTDAEGNASFDVTFADDAVQVVTATATSLDTGDTSEFSLVAQARATADLALAASGAPSLLEVGQDLTYTLTVTNNGPSNATSVVLVDTLPGGVTFGSATGGVTPNAQGVLTFSLPGLAAGASATLTIVVRPTAEGTLINQATVTSDQFDPTPGDTTRTVSTTVQNISVVEFGAADFVAREDAGAAAIVVRRSRSTIGEVRVTYMVTTGGTATAGSDYEVLATGTLVFPNEMSTTEATINVSLIRDMLVEGNETVTFALTDPTGRSRLGTQATATLTILDVNTFAVTNKDDNGDNANPLAGSLRAAIVTAIANPGVNTISFQISGSGVQVIPVAENPLPDITAPVIIDGYSQGGATPNTDPEGNNANPFIVLDG
ncbi:MAG TPA: Calx-beta domain-containing protein, partial [Isosphaeraceae bacterium]